jgi:hypothetical protein
LPSVCKTKKSKTILVLKEILYKVLLMKSDLNDLKEIDNGIDAKQRHTKVQETNSHLINGNMKRRDSRNRF